MVQHFWCEETIQRQIPRRENDGEMELAEACAWNLRPGFNYLLAHHFYQTNIILNLAYLLFFRLRQNCFEYFMFDTRYDQRVSGFILSEDATKSTFLTLWASALLFLGVRIETFRTTLFWHNLRGPTESRSRACCLGRMVKVASAGILRPGFNTLVGHRFYQTNIILNLAY